MRDTPCEPHPLRGCVKMQINNLTTINHKEDSSKSKEKTISLLKIEYRNGHFYWIVSNCKIIKMIFAF